MHNDIKNTCIKFVHMTLIWEHTAVINKSSSSCYDKMIFHISLNMNDWGILHMLGKDSTS